MEPLPHPIDTLLDEHRTILAVLGEMENECRYLDRGGAVREPFWRRVLQFLDEFDERLHHDKEEGLLFPALEAAGLSPHAGPTVMLRSEHERCRQWRHAIDRALARGERLQLAAVVQGLVDLQRQHIQKENMLLLPLSRQLLSPATFAAMACAFAARDDGVIASAAAGRAIS